ncbi:MAG TPA: PLDc N-terminal domain-containing protein [Puia sp.]|nr:PLDc N-terminal domain-containing protein [Puia sp.]
MFRMFPGIPGYIYYISIALQVICVLHCIRSGTQQRWIWLIVFVPYIGSIAYFFSEILPKRNMGAWQAGLGSLLVSPAARIRRLEQNLQFANTFNNRVMLANAYMLSGRTEEAIELYSTSLTGAFTENEYVINRLIGAYFQTERYPELIELARKIYHTPAFARSHAHLFYARALDITGDKEGAESEFRKMKGRFADFEARYQYGLFLQRAGRDSEAQNIWEDIIKEGPHLSSRERRANYLWIQKSKEEVRKGRPVELRDATRPKDNHQ